MPSSNQNVVPCSGAALRQVIHKSTITMGAADEWNAKAPSGRGEAAADAGAQFPIRCMWVASLSSNGSCVCHPPDLGRAIALESINCPREHGAKRRQRFPAACFGSRARAGSGVVRVSSMPRWVSTSLIFAKSNALAALAVGSNTTEMGLPEGRVEGGSGNPIIPPW